MKFSIHWPDFVCELREQDTSLRLKTGATSARSWTDYGWMGRKFLSDQSSSTG
jgi:hypothetical protein